MGWMDTFRQKSTTPEEAVRCVLSGDRVFVSGNAVVGLEEAGTNHGFPPGSREGVRVAAVGTRTSEKARDLGWNVSVVPDRENAEGLLDALVGNDMEGRTVWIPSA